METFFALVAIFIWGVVICLLYGNIRKTKKGQGDQARPKENKKAVKPPSKETEKPAEEAKKPTEDGKIDQDYQSAPVSEADAVSTKNPTDVFESREISKKEEIRTEDGEAAAAPASATPVVISTRSHASGSRSERYFSHFTATRALDIRVKRNYFTREQAAKYAERSGSSRLERALSQEMLLVNLYTDTVTIPHRAEATVYSLHSGLQYQTSLTQCSCPDHQKTNAPCKHMLALALHVGAIELKK